MTHKPDYRVVSPCSERTQGNLDVLTPRERQVYELAATGMSIHDMADRLFVESCTTKKHLVSIRRKLGMGIPNRVPYRHKPVPIPIDRMTSREREVCELARRGYADAQIAERLCISIRTVAIHLHNARQRVQELEAS